MSQMISQQELAKRFALFENAESIPDASNVSVKKADDEAPHDAYIVGYGWAIYASRSVPNGVTYYKSWEGYSPSTSCQMAELRKGFNDADVVYDTETRSKLATRTHGWRARQADADAV